jgi:hypothetical protein
MSTLATNLIQPLLSGAPTGAIYCLPVAKETGVEQLPALDTEALIGLCPLPCDYTGVTLRHEALLDEVADQARRLGACIGVVGAGLDLLGAPAVFESTPVTMVHAHAGVLNVLLRESADEPLLPERAPAAYRAFKDLVRWLDADDMQIADMVGIGRTTPYTWKREGREPRTATAQRIYEHHATLDSLRRRLGANELRRWLHEGIPTRRDRLLAGGLEALEGDVHALLFRSAPGQRIDLAASPEDTAPIVTMAAAAPVLPSGRRPRRPVE